MRRILRLLLLVYVLTIPAGAVEGKRYAALVVESSANPHHTQQLLDGFSDRGIQATFLFQGWQLSGSPILLERIPQEGHQFGCRGYSGKNMVYMSRREIAAEIMDFEALLPNGYPLRLFCPPGGVSDGVRQVAQARRLGILSWSADVETPISEIQDGDLILLRDSSLLSVEKALALADGLLEENFDLVTVSELAKLRQTPIRPGEVYHSFPIPDAP